VNTTTFLTFTCSSFSRISNAGTKKRKTAGIRESMIGKRRSMPSRHRKAQKQKREQEGQQRRKLLKLQLSKRKRKKVRKEPRRRLR
jgi:hypothetical protein